MDSTYIIDMMEKSKSSYDYYCWMIKYEKLCINDLIKENKYWRKYFNKLGLVWNDIKWIGTCEFPIRRSILE